MPFQGIILQWSLAPKPLLIDGLGEDAPALLCQLTSETARLAAGIGEWRPLHIHPRRAAAAIPSDCHASVKTPLFLLPSVYRPSSLYGDFVISLYIRIRVKKQRCGHA